MTRATCRRRWATRSRPWHRSRTHSPRRSSRLRRHRLSSCGAAPRQGVLPRIITSDSGCCAGWSKRSPCALSTPRHHRSWGHRRFSLQIDPLGPKRTAMSDADLIPLVQSLAGAHVLCVGDVMLDHFVYGRVERVSPEAPVPVLHVEREQRSLGGAGNVLRNLQTLGAQPCFVSVTGSDRAGRDVGRLVAELGGGESHVLTERGRVTTVKTRYVAGTQQMMRADRETVTPLTGSLREDFLRMVQQVLAHYQVTVLSDYAKGVLAGGAAAEIIASARAARHIV